MLFNLNKFLIAVSFALDFVEMDVLGVTSNHGKRTAYMSLKIASKLGLSSEELYDIVACAILHDNGVSEKTLHDKFLGMDSVSSKSIESIKEHCTIGEDNVKEYPFLTWVDGVIKYHHERYDGKGFFNVKGEEIPLMSRIIYLADSIEVSFDLQSTNVDTERIIKYVNSYNESMFCPKVVEAFNTVASDKAFWMDLKNDFINSSLRENTPHYDKEMSFDEIRKITGVFSKIIDSKSKYTQRHSRDLSQKTAVMADYYKMSKDDKLKLVIAADLHDIGKLAVPNSILDSPEKLSEEEFEIVKKHPYLTRIALSEVDGFEDITEWASNHHEKLNGKGYPFGKAAEDLDFNSRLIGCLDIYEALTEERPYRMGLTHDETMKIMNNMKDEGFIDASITNDIDNAFR